MPSTLGSSDVFVSLKLITDLALILGGYMPIVKMGKATKLYQNKEWLNMFLK